MKKIYMILAAITLLSMSLNAQIILTEWIYPSSFPTTWTVPSTGSGTVGGYYFGGSSGADIVIPASDLQGNTTVNVELTAATESTWSSHTVSVNGTTSSPALTTTLTELTWENVNATNGITIHVSDYYVDISEIHVYAMVTDPLINASPNSLSMSAAPGGTSTEMVTVAGYNLTGNINASISGDAVFSVDPTILGATGGSLTVTYSPTAPGNHNATITLTSDGAEAVTINLTGSCVAGTTYELVTDPSTQLVDGEKYILVGNTKYAMGAISSNVGTVVAITDNGDGTVTVPGTASPLVFTLHSYSSNYTSGYALEANGNYLRPSSSSGTGLTTATTSNDNTCWSPIADSKSTGGYGIQYSYLSTSRAVSFRESSTVSARFAYYAKTNITATSNEYFYGLLYKEVSNKPMLTAPEDGATVNVGTLEEGGETSVSVTVPVSGRNLTEDVTVNVSGTGFSVTPTTLSAADVNAGTTVTVTYEGTANGTGTLTFSSPELDEDVTVNLTATYISHDPALTAPENGSTVDVGTNSGLGVNKNIAVSGNYLTENLTVTVSGTGFRVSPTTLTADDVNAGTTITVTYNGTTPNATGTLTISSGEVSVTVNLTATYSTGIEPVVHGMVRMGTLPIVDQFAEKIPPTNDHPYRYTYFLKLASRDTTSSPAHVPVQHTGAEIEGYYSQTQMDEDTDPANFLTTDMLSAEVDMNLSPASAPYFYTINSVLNDVPQSAEDWDSYLNVLQRREAGDYQEMQAAYTYDGANIPNPNRNRVYASGENNFFDYRDIQAQNKSDSLSYVPIVWTKGIDRHYYTTDSLHNSYGAPLWEVRTGDVSIGNPVIERQAKNANGDWNASVNWYDENSNKCSLFMIKDLHATGVLPVSNVEYEPYMFRLWVICDGLRNMTTDPNTGNAVNDPDADRTSPRLLYTKYCQGADDLTLDIVKDATNWDNNVTFGGLNTIEPTFLVRFYYVVKGYQKTRDGNDPDHVGYVVKAEKDPGVMVAVNELEYHGEIVNQTYYNIQGMESDKPFQGVNIVVTRFSDGTTSVSKVVR